MSDTKKIDENSQTVQTHLGILQNVIERMATNSTSCKTWCLTIVSAILVAVADKKQSSLVAIALVPTVFLMVIDAYYLSLEQAFRRSYDKFVQKLHDGDLVSLDLYSVRPDGSTWRGLLKSLVSFASLAFYVAMLSVILVSFRLVK